MSAATARRRTGPAPAGNFWQTAEAPAPERGSAPLEITWSRRPGVLIARVSGELDMDSAPRFRDGTDEAVAASRAGLLVLNLSKVTFLDSAGVGAILGRYRVMAGLGGRVAVVTGSARLTRLLEMAGVPQVMGCYRTEGEAVAALEAAVPREVRGG